jgi:hypothetical protein
MRTRPSSWYDSDKSKGRNEMEMLWKPPSAVQTDGVSGSPVTLLHPSQGLPPLSFSVLTICLSTLKSVLLDP